MKFKECIFLIRNNIFRSQNIIFFFTLSLLISIVFGCVITMYFSYDVKESTLNKDIIYRKINTNMSKEEALKLPHVLEVENSRYNNQLYSEISKYTKQDNPSSITIYPLFGSINIDIVSGRKIENKQEAICPDKFYPYNYDETVNSSLFIHGKDIIGNTFIISSQNEDNIDSKTEFSIVGTYKNIPWLELNACFISKEELFENTSKYSFITTTTSNGKENVSYHEYKTNIVFVDKYENVKRVATEIEEKGYFADTSFLDEQLIAYIFYIPLFIFLIVIIIVINVLYNFISKKCKYKTYKYGILKAIGYKDNNIIKIEIYENIFITLVAFIIASIIISVCYGLVLKLVLSEFVYYNYYLPIPICLLIASSFIIISIIFFITKAKIKTILNCDISTLLGSEEY